MAARHRTPRGRERRGIVLLKGALRGRFERDTIGPLALDTGAGFLALDLDLARTLGPTDTTMKTPEAVGLAQHPLPRLRLGGLTLDWVTPVLTVDGEVMRRVSDRLVLGWSDIVRSATVSSGSIIASRWWR